MPTLLIDRIDNSANSAGEQTSFETAADAIAQGDETTLARLLRRIPALAHARSSRRHQATLLHYIGANGVENYRQRTPPNAVQLLELLLQANSEVDAVAEIYGGSTTLGLVATSVHPQRAGLQIALMERLLDAGAQIGVTDSSLIRSCLGNGQPAAAEFLVSRGAKLDLASALGLGRLAKAKSLVGHEGPHFESTHTYKENSIQGFLWACSFGHQEVVKSLLDSGVNIAVQDHQGQTGLHLAAMQRDTAMVKFLLLRKAPLEMQNAYGGTPLGQSLWSASHSSHPDQYAAVIEALLAAGAETTDMFSPITEAIDQVLAEHRIL